MQFIDLNKQYQAIRVSVQQRIDAVLQHGQFIMGPEIMELEQRLASYVGCKYCISCSSGTDALLLALMAHEVGPGDAIFTTTFTFIATAEVICLLGATPIFVDIDQRTFNIDPGQLQKAVRDTQNGKNAAPGIPKNVRPRGIIAVDIFGLPSDYDAISQIASEHGLFVVGDAAQSFGGMYKDRRVCSLAEISTTSFFPAKPLGCYGDGGAIMTDNEALAERMRSLRVHGKGADKYDNVRIGINGRLDTLQAAILLAKLEVFDEEIASRQTVARRYSEGIGDVVVVPHVPQACRSAWAQYSVLSTRRATLTAKLKEVGVPTAVYYPKPLHLQKAFSFLGYAEGIFPVAERVSDQIFSLPMHPYLEERDQDRIITTIRTT